MPPNADYVKLLQKRWKVFAKDNNVFECSIQLVMSQDCQVVKHNYRRIFIAFKADSGKSFTSYQLTIRQSLNHDKNGIIGQNYKN